MINIDDASSSLYEYLLDTVKLSAEELRSIKTALFYIRESAPTDIPLIINKINSLISSSEDLSWVISVVSRKQHSIKREIKTIKDPEYVMLVRQKRPSAAAIDSEIRFNHPELSKLEEDLEIINNTLEYLKHIEVSIDRYIWLLKDKMNTRL